MKLTELLLAALEREAAVTRSTMQRVPEGHNDWKPHPTSMALGYLASLIATLPAWIATMVNQDELDLKSPGAAKFKAPEWSKRTELVTALDASLAQAREALARFGVLHVWFSHDECCVIGDFAAQGHWGHGR